MQLVHCELLQVLVGKVILVITYTTENCWKETTTEQKTSWNKTFHTTVNRNGLFSSILAGVCEDYAIDSDLLRWLLAACSFNIKVVLYCSLMYLLGQKYLIPSYFKLYY